MNKQYSLVMFSKLIFVLLISLGASRAVYADSSPFVGTWIVESNYPTTGLRTKFFQNVDKEKSIIATSAIGQTGYGIWRKAGKHKYQTKSSLVIGPDDPYGFPKGAIATFVSTATYDKQSDTFTTTGTATWTFGENNEVLWQEDYTSIYRRYTFDD